MEVTMEHAMWLLFAWVLANQGGAPIPVVPSLVGAGALAGTGHASIPTIVAVAVTASLVADLAWYSVGRWRGAQALALLAKLPGPAAARVKMAEERFVTHQVAFLFGSRFLPEANPLAAGMAGAARIAPGRYIAIVTASALVWAGGWIGAGCAVANVTTELPRTFGVVTTVFVLAAAIACLGFVLKRRRCSSPG
jgi:membrane protein DedA with SNARE-associated domain